MAGQITDEDRARVVELTRTGMSRNEVSRQTGVSTASVSRIALAAGLNFNRDQTRAATEAKVTDAKARRAQMSLDLLDDVEHVRAVLRGTERAQALMHTSRAVSDLLAAHERLVDMGQGDSVDEAKSMIGGLAEGLKHLYGDMGEESA